MLVHDWEHRPWCSWPLPRTLTTHLWLSSYYVPWPSLSDSGVPWCCFAAVSMALWDAAWRPIQHNIQKKTCELNSPPLSICSVCSREFDSSSAFALNFLLQQQLHLWTSTVWSTCIWTCHPNRRVPVHMLPWTMLALETMPDVASRRDTPHTARRHARWAAVHEPFLHSPTTLETWNSHGNSEHASAMRCLQDFPTCR